MTMEGNMRTPDVFDLLYYYSALLFGRIVYYSVNFLISQPFILQDIGHFANDILKNKSLYTMGMYLFSATILRQVWWSGAHR